MNVKQITIRVNALEGEQLVVYSPEGKVLSGDENRAIALGSTNHNHRTITVYGIKGESFYATSAIHDRNGNHISCESFGDIDTISEMLRNMWPELDVRESPKRALIPSLLRHSYLMCNAACQARSINARYQNEHVSEDIEANPRTRAVAQCFALLDD